MRTFKQRLSDVIRSASSMRDNLQSLIVEAIDHAEQNNDDFVYMTMLTRRVIGVKALNTDQLRHFIKAHVSNAQWAKLKDGSYGWRKAKKGQPCEYQKIETNWYDFEAPGVSKPTPYNEDKARSTLKKVAKRLESEAEFDDDQVANLLIEFATSLQSGEIDLGVKSA